VDPGTLYAIAHQLYWDFKRLAEGRSESLQKLAFVSGAAIAWVSIAQSNLKSYAN